MEGLLVSRDIIIQSHKGEYEVNFVHGWIKDLNARDIKDSIFLIDSNIAEIYKQDLEDILRSFKLDVRIIGEEYKEKNYTGRVYCEEKGIDLYYNSRDHRFSSSGLRKQVKSVEDK